MILIQETVSIIRKRGLASVASRGACPPQYQVKLTFELFIWYPKHNYIFITCKKFLRSQNYNNYREKSKFLTAASNTEIVDRNRKADGCRFQNLQLITARIVYVVLNNRWNRKWLAEVEVMRDFSECKPVKIFETLDQPMNYFESNNVMKSACKLI